MVRLAHRTVVYLIFLFIDSILFCVGKVPWTLFRFSVMVKNDVINWLNYVRPTYQCS